MAQIFKSNILAHTFASESTKTRHFVHGRKIQNAAPNSILRRQALDLASHLETASAITACSAITTV